MGEWNISAPTTEYYDHTSPNIQHVVNEVLATPEIAIDTETTGLAIMSDLPLYWSLSWGTRRMTLGASALPFFEDAFRDPNKLWIFANAKYDAHILANVGITIAGCLADIQVMHALLYEERSHRLKDINEDLFGWKWADFQDTFGKIGKKQSAEDRIRKAERENFDLLVEYAANDAWGTKESYYELKKRLQNAQTYSLFRDRPPYIETLWDLFSKVEVPYTKVLWKNERNGILVDQDYLDRIRPQAKQEITDIEREICKEAGTMLNPNSTKQLREYFFDKMNIRPLKKTSGGKTGVRNPSVDRGFLEHYANQYPVADLVLRHRKLSKLYGTYIEGIGKYLDNNSRVHTRFNQDVARTGRLSSSDPNLQNIPNPTNDKWCLRGAFIAPDDCDLLVHDYRQLEMRLLACASEEPGMVEVINKGWDIHMGNASMIFGMPYDEIKEAKRISNAIEEGQMAETALTPRMIECLQARAAAKTIGFGIVYGMGPAKLANSLKITRAEAEAKLAQFKRTYPAIDAFTAEAVRETRETGYAFTIMGRRRNVPQIISNRNDERMQGERIAVNTQIQGSAADVVKMAQILLDKLQLDRRYDCHGLLQIHDELVHQAPKAAIPEMRSEIKLWMEHPFSMGLAVALETDDGVGRSWMDAK
jgi:DNA polymerase-1